jgi:hypothetical protein
MFLASQVRHLDHVLYNLGPLVIGAILKDIQQRRQHFVAPSGFPYPRPKGIRFEDLNHVELLLPEASKGGQEAGPDVFYCFEFELVEIVFISHGNALAFVVACPSYCGCYFNRLGIVKTLTSGMVNRNVGWRDSSERMEAWLPEDDCGHAPDNRKCG